MLHPKGLAALALAAWVLVGCRTVTKHYAPEPEAAFAFKEGVTLQFAYTDPKATNFFRTVYRTAAGPKEQRRVRNDVIDELMGLINQNYRKYEVDLRAGRTTFDVLSTLTAMGLTAAATAVGGEETKTILSAIATGVLGANAAVDKALFKDLTTEALASQMQALRAERAKLIFEGRKKSLDEYSLNNALDDLVEYYNAGFVTRALQALVVKTGEAAKQAQEEANEAR